MKYQYRIMGNGTPGKKNPVFDRIPEEWSAALRQAQVNFKKIRLERRTILEPADIDPLTMPTLKITGQEHTVLDNGNVVIEWETIASYLP